MKNELAKKEETAIAAAQDFGVWGEETVGQDDVLIPRIILMQPMNDEVTAGKVKMGDLYDNVNDIVVGGFDQPVAFLPFYHKVMWQRYKLTSGGGKPEYIDTLDDPQKTKQLPFIEDHPDGYQIKNVRVSKFMGFLRNEDGEISSLPCEISFKSSSSKAGKKLFTQMYVTNKAARLVPCAYWISVETRRESNDSGTYAVMDVRKSTSASAEEIQQCVEWFHAVKNNEVQIKEGPDSDEIPSLKPGEYEEEKY